MLQFALRPKSKLIRYYATTGEHGIKRDFLAQEPNSPYYPVEQLIQQDLTKAWSAFRKTKKKNKPTSVGEYNFFIDLYAKLRNYKEVLNYYLQLKQHPGLKPDTNTYGVLLNLYSCDFPKEALPLLEEMKPENIKFTTYKENNSILHIYAKLDMHEQAREHFEIIKSEDLCDTSSFTILIDMYSKLKLTDDAVQIFRDMKNQGIVPSQYTFNTLITMYAHSNNPKDVEFVYLVVKEMQELGLSPDIVTYNTLLNMYQILKQPEEALNIFQEMKNNEIKPDIYTYNILINMFAKRFEPDQAFSVYKEMTENGISPNAITYCSLMDMHIKTNQPEKALALFSEMKEQAIEINVIAFNILVHLYAKQDQPQKAAAILDEMKHHGVKPDVVTFNSLIDMYAKLQQEEEALSILNQKMPEAEVQPDIVTYNSIIFLYAQLKKPREAFATFDKIIELGMKPDIATYTEMIQMFCALLLKDDALIMVERMNKVGLELTCPIYNAFMRMNLELNKPKVSFRYYNEMLSKGIEPSPYTHVLLSKVRQLCRKHNEEENRQ